MLCNFPFLKYNRDGIIAKESGMSMITDTMVGSIVIKDSPARKACAKVFFFFNAEFYFFLCFFTDV